MVSRTELGAALIGRTAVDSRRRRMGRVIAVIHKAHGADVLIEGRVWLRRRTYRFAVEAVTRLPGNRVLVDMHPAADAAAVSTARGAVSADRR